MAKEVSHDAPAVQTEIAKVFVTDEDEAEDTCCTCCCSTKKLESPLFVQRYSTLTVICLLSLGSFCCYDIPETYRDNAAHDMKVRIESIPDNTWCMRLNVVLCIVTGVFIDRVLGIQLAVFIFSCVSFAGQLLVFFHCDKEGLWVLELRRTVIRIGVENLAVALHTFVARQFLETKRQSASYVLLWNIARLVSSVYIVVAPLIPRYFADMSTSPDTFFRNIVYFGLCSFLYAPVLLLFHLLDRKEKTIFWNRQSAEVVQRPKLKDFPCAFWLYAALCVVFYIGVFPLFGTGQMFEMTHNNNVTTSHAAHTKTFKRRDDNGLAASILSNMNGVFGKNFGIPTIQDVDCGIFDKFFICFGVYYVSLFDPEKLKLYFHPNFVALCGIAFFLVTFAFATILSHPYPGLAFISIMNYSIIGALFSGVAVEIPKHQLGLAYGILQSILNISAIFISRIVYNPQQKDGFSAISPNFHFIIIWIICLCLFYCDTNKDVQKYHEMLPEEEETERLRKEQEQKNEMESWEEGDIDNKQLSSGSTNDNVKPDDLA